MGTFGCTDSWTLVSQKNNQRIYQGTKAILKIFSSHYTQTQTQSKQDTQSVIQNISQPRMPTFTSSYAPVFILFLLPLLIYSDQPASNTMTFISDFALAKQNDVNQTFTQIQKNITISELNHTERIGKTYRIYDFQPIFTVIDSRQTATVNVGNIVNVSGAITKITYKFKWEKKQLGASVRGTAEGAVLSDKIGFLKTITIDADSDEPIWIVTEAPNVTFSNSFSVTKVNPYNANDTEILDLMLNKNQGQPTGKQLVTDAINENYAKLLNASARSHSEDIQINKTIVYTYNSYRGPQRVSYQNLVTNVILQHGQGLVFTFVQYIKDFPDFEYGENVSQVPHDPAVYGGHQTYMNLELIKSTVKYALTKNYFDVALSQQAWQSRAFQFCVGDLYQVIPTLKSLPADTEVKGKCIALNDQSFNFSSNINETLFRVDVNFNCSLDTANVTSFSKFSVVSTSYIRPTLLKKNLQFTIQRVSARANFIEVPGYKIENEPLAKFLIEETVMTAVGSTVFGTTYPTSTRLYPNLKITDKYLFLYDSSVRGVTL